LDPALDAAERTLRAVGTKDSFAGAYHSGIQSWLPVRVGSRCGNDEGRSDECEEPGKCDAREASALARIL